MKNYYEILGVEETADADTIKKAYRKLAIECHPDVSDSPDAEDKFKDINEANDVLSDPNKRRAYDNRHNNPFGNLGNRSSWDDVRYTRQSPRMGNTDVVVQYVVKLKETFAPITTTIKYTKRVGCTKCNAQGGTDPITCPQCGGTGVNHQDSSTLFAFFRVASPCVFCMGKGKVFKQTCEECNSFGMKSSPVECVVTLPIGCAYQHFIVEGFGNQERTEYPPGNLIVQVSVQAEMPFNMVAGFNCYYSLKLDPVEALLGGEYDVPTLDGSECRVVIPGGCLNGHREELKSMGIPKSEFERGSLIVEIQYNIPKHLTDAQKNTLLEYLRLRKEGE